MNKQETKQKISTILLEALNGFSKKYRTKNGYIQWGLVEQDIHKLIDQLPTPQEGGIKSRN